jgi:nucleoside-diphosphate-sugar epimerase
MTPVRMKILLVGATGVVGRCVLNSLQAHHDVISASLDPAKGDHEVQLDLSDADALVKTLKSLGQLDAVISAAGRARFGALADARPASVEASVYGLGLLDKLQCRS